MSQERQTEPEGYLTPSWLPEMEALFSRNKQLLGNDALKKAAARFAQVPISSIQSNDDARKLIAQHWYQDGWDALFGSSENDPPWCPIEMSRDLEARFHDDLEQDLPTGHPTESYLHDRYMAEMRQRVLRQATSDDAQDGDEGYSTPPLPASRATERDKSARAKQNRQENRKVSGQDGIVFNDVKDQDGQDQDQDLSTPSQDPSSSSEEEAASVPRRTSRLRTPTKKRRDADAAIQEKAAAAAKPVNLDDSDESNDDLDLGLDDSEEGDAESSPATGHSAEWKLGSPDGSVPLPDGDRAESFWRLNPLLVLLTSRHGTTSHVTFELTEALVNYIGRQGIQLCPQLQSKGKTKWEEIPAAIIGAAPGTIPDNNPCHEVDLFNLSPPAPKADTIQVGGTYKKLENVPWHLARSCTDFPTAKLRNAEHRRSGTLFFLNDEESLDFRDPAWFEAQESATENSEVSLSSSDEASEDAEDEPEDDITQASETSSEILSSRRSRSPSINSNWDDLEKFVDSSLSGYEASQKRRGKTSVLFKAAHNCAANMTRESKDRSSLQKIRSASCSEEIDSHTGAHLPRGTPVRIKEAATNRVMQGISEKPEELILALHEWFCLHCATNRETLSAYLVQIGNDVQLPLPDRTLGKIKTLGPDRVICGQCHKLGTPPLRSFVACPNSDCGKWFLTSGIEFTPACQHCGVRFSFAIHARTKLSSQKEGSLLDVSAQSDKQRFEYLRAHSDSSRADAPGKPATSFHALARALYDTSLDPSISSHVYSITLTNRVLTYGIRIFFDYGGSEGLCLMDGLSVTQEPRSQTKTLTAAALNDLVKGKTSPGPCNTPDWFLRLPEQDQIRQLCQAHQNIMTFLADICGDAFALDPAVNWEVLSKHFLLPSKLPLLKQEVVYSELMASLVDLSKRLDKKMTNPGTDLLYFSEKEAGSCFRFVFVANNHEFIKRIALPTETAINQAASLTVAKTLQPPKPKVEPPSSKPPQEKSARQKTPVKSAVKGGGKGSQKSYPDSKASGKPRMISVGKLLQELRSDTLDAHLSPSEDSISDLSPPTDYKAAGISFSHNLQFNMDLRAKNHTPLPILREVSRPLRRRQQVPLQKKRGGVRKNKNEFRSGAQPKTTPPAVVAETAAKNESKSTPLPQDTRVLSPTEQCLTPCFQDRPNSASQLMSLPADPSFAPESDDDMPELVSDSDDTDTLSSSENEDDYNPEELSEESSAASPDVVITSFYWEEIQDQVREGRSFVARLKRNIQLGMSAKPQASEEAAAVKETALADLEPPIEQLVAMGFDRDAAYNALTTSEDNLERAVSILVSTDELLTLDSASRVITGTHDVAVVKSWSSLPSKNYYSSLNLQEPEENSGNQSSKDMPPRENKSPSLDGLPKQGRDQKFSKPSGNKSKKFVYSFAGKFFSRHKTPHQRLTTPDKLSDAQEEVLAALCHDHPAWPLVTASATPGRMLLKLEGFAKQRASRKAKPIYKAEEQRSAKNQAGNEQKQQNVIQGTLQVDLYDTEHRYPATVNLKNQFSENLNFLKNPSSEGSEDGDDYNRKSDPLSPCQTLQETEVKATQHCVEENSEIPASQSLSQGFSGSKEVFKTKLEDVLHIMDVYYGIKWFGRSISENFDFLDDPDATPPRPRRCDRYRNKALSESMKLQELQLHRVTKATFDPGVHNHKLLSYNPLALARVKDSWLHSHRNRHARYVFQRRLLFTHQYVVHGPKSVANINPQLQGDWADHEFLMAIDDMKAAARPGSKSSNYYSALEIHGQEEEAQTKEESGKEESPDDRLPLLYGHNAGLNSPPDFRKLQYLMPHIEVKGLDGKDAKKFCLLHQTQRGCSREDCNHSHVLVASKHLTPAHHSLMNFHGGHQDLRGSLDLRKLDKLLSPAQQEKAAKLSKGERIHFSRRVVDTVLRQVAMPASIPLSARPIQDGDSLITRTVIWPGEVGIRFSTASGIEVESSSLAFIGKKDALFLLHLRDVGDCLTLPLGPVTEEIHHMCQIKARIAACRHVPHSTPQIPHARSDVRLWCEVMEDLTKISLSELAKNPTSRLAELVVTALVQEDWAPGLPDSVWSIVNPPLLSQHHCATITVPKNVSSPLCFYISLAGTRWGRETTFSKANIHRLVARKFPYSATKFPVSLVTNTIFKPGMRHAEAALLDKKMNLATFIAKVVSMVQAGQGILTVTGRGEHHELEKGCSRSGLAVPSEAFEAAKKNQAQIKLLLERHNSASKSPDPPPRMEDPTCMSTASVSDSLAAGKTPLPLAITKTLSPPVGPVDLSVKDGTSELGSLVDDESPELVSFLEKDDPVDNDPAEKHHPPEKNTVAINRPANDKDVKATTQASTHYGKGKHSSKVEVEVLIRRKEDSTERCSIARGLLQTSIKLKLRFGSSVASLLAELKEATNIEDKEVHSIYVDGIALREKSFDLKGLSTVVPEERKAHAPPLIVCISLEDQEQSKSRQQIFDDWLGKGKSGKEMDWPQLWKDTLLPQLRQISETTEYLVIKKWQAVTGILFNRWFIRELKNRQKQVLSVDNEEKMSLEAIVTALREVYKGRVAPGPPVNEVMDLVGGTLPSSHVAAIRDQIVHGADPLHLAPSDTGYIGKSYPLPEEALESIARDQMEDIGHQRLLLFDTSDSFLRVALIAAGVRVAPIVTVHKLDNAGRPRMDANNKPKLRTCTDCTDGGHEAAANTEISSLDHPFQCTTSAEHVALLYLQEQRRHPDRQLIVCKEDVASAFKLIGTSTNKVGTFAIAADDYTSVNLVMVFGSSSSPGQFEIQGGAILPTLFAESRCQGDPPLQPIRGIGEEHPSASRFVDDILSLTATYVNRPHDHLTRLRRVITGLLGPESINLDKQAVEGQLSNFTHAFGPVLNCLDRKMFTSWSKIVKLWDLCSASYIADSEAPLTYGETTKIAGVARVVLFCCPGLARMTLPRLNMALSHAAKARGGSHAIPTSDKTHPALRGESRTQGHRMLKAALRLLFWLAVERRGALFEITMEQALPKDIRLSFPGNESEQKSLHRYLMDSSGKSLYVIDLSSGKSIKVDFPAEMMQVFNNFEDDPEHAVTINHCELLSELFAAVLLGPDHAGEILEMINDNVTAQRQTETSKHRDSRVDRILSIMGLVEIMLRVTIWGARVTSEDNFADYNTRLDEAGMLDKHLTKLRELEQKHGWVSVPQAVPPYLLEKGLLLSKEEDEDDTWFNLAVWVVTNIEITHPGVILTSSGSSPAFFIEAIRNSWEGKLPPASTFSTEKGDIPEACVSSARKAVTTPIAITRNQLHKSLVKLQQNLGEAKGASVFNAKHQAPPGQEPELTVNKVLQAQFQTRSDVLRVDNLLYTPGVNPRLAVIPTEPPQLQLGCRAPNWSVPVLECYSGAHSWGQAVTDSQLGHVVACFERDPEQRGLTSQLITRSAKSAHLTTALAPPQIHKWVSEARGPQFRHGGALESAVNLLSPPCQEHSSANNHKQGNASLLGQEFEETGRILEHTQPAVAVVECTIGVLRPNTGVRGLKGSASPLERLKVLAPSYHICPVQVNASMNRSPLNGSLAAVHHVRAHVFCFRKDCFKDGPPQVQANNTPPPANAIHTFDEPNETPYYRCLPLQDQQHLRWQPVNLGKSGSATVATLHEPEAGRGNCFCPNEVKDLTCALRSPNTGSGRDTFTQRLLNGTPRVIQTSLMETWRAYAARRVPPPWRLQNSEGGYNAVGNYIPQNQADWSWMEAFTAASTVQSDNVTAFERWQRRVPDRKASGKPTSSSGSAARFRTQLVTDAVALTGPDFPVEFCRVRQLTPDGEWHTLEVPSPYFQRFHEERTGSTVSSLAKQALEIVWESAIDLVSTTATEQGCYLAVAGPIFQGLAPLPGGFFIPGITNCNMSVVKKLGSSDIAYILPDSHTRLARILSEVVLQMLHEHGRTQLFLCSIHPTTSRKRKAYSQDHPEPDPSSDSGQARPPVAGGHNTTTTHSPLVSDTHVPDPGGSNQVFTFLNGTNIPTSLQLVNTIIARRGAIRDFVVEHNLLLLADHYAGGRFPMASLEQQILVQVGRHELNAALAASIPFDPSTMTQRWLWLLERLHRDEASQADIPLIELQLEHTAPVFTGTAPCVYVTEPTALFTASPNTSMPTDYVPPYPVTDNLQPELRHYALHTPAQRKHREHVSGNFHDVPGNFHEVPGSTCQINDDEWEDAFFNDLINHRPLTPNEQCLGNEFPERPNSASLVKTASKRARRCGSVADALTFTKAVQETGKSAQTLANYARDGQQWATYAHDNGWPWRLDDVPTPTRQQRMIQWLSHLHGLGVSKASTAHKKISAVRHLHIAAPLLLPDPFENLPGLTNWLNDWQRLDGPAQGALPVPLQLVEGICMLLDPKKLSHANIIAAFAYGLGLMGRASEYLADGKKPGMRMQDLTFRTDTNAVIAHKTLRAQPTLLTSVTEISFHISCGKNKNVDSTRSLPRSRRALCAVEAVINLLLVFYRDRGSLPVHDAPLFLKPSGKPLHRRDISAWLKAGAKAAGLPPARFSSHSLRKGGASYMAATGVPDEVIQRFGRWSSDCYKRYIQMDAHTIKSWATKTDAAHQTALGMRFESN